MYYTGIIESAIEIAKGLVRSTQSAIDGYLFAAYPNRAEIEQTLEELLYYSKKFVAVCYLPYEDLTNITDHWEVIKNFLPKFTGIEEELNDLGYRNTQYFYLTRLIELLQDANSYQRFLSDYYTNPSSYDLYVYDPIPGAIDEDLRYWYEMAKIVQEYEDLKSRSYTRRRLEEFSRNNSIPEKIEKLRSIKMILNVRVKDHKQTEQEKPLYKLLNSLQL